MRDEFGSEVPEVPLTSANGNPGRTAFLGMPYYGTLTYGAAKGLFRATRKSLAIAVRQVQPREIDRAELMMAGGSLLVQNCNILWADALNRVHRGEALDYFAMLHADVAPEDGWLDILADEAEARGLDVISCVIPIKDPRGRTSTAVGEAFDNFRVRHRLTMREVWQLPETFTSADVNGQLLVNTGCMLVRWDQAKCRDLYFDSRNRIVYDLDADEYRVMVEPEDWFISRAFHAHKMAVGATRKVRLAHRGAVDFSNDHPWGDEFDREYLDAPVLDLPPDNFEFPHDVAGWLTYAEGRALWDLARGKRVLEVGSYCGRSTICLAQAAEYVLTVDPHDCRGTPGPRRDTQTELVANLQRYEVGDRVIVLERTFDKAEPAIGAASETFDLVFLDGDHSTDVVRADIRRALALLAPEGLLAFHDYRTAAGQGPGGWDPGVNLAVNELLSSGAQLVSHIDSLAVVRPAPAAVLQEV